MGAGSHHPKRAYSIGWAIVTCRKVLADVLDVFTLILIQF